MGQRVAYALAAAFGAFALVMVGAVLAYVMLGRASAAGTSAGVIGSPGRGIAYAATPQTRDSGSRPAYAVTPEQAIETALAAIPGAQPFGTPRLVSLGGTPAYEVRLSLGTVYVDVSNGGVLSTNTIPQNRRGRIRPGR